MHTSKLTKSVDYLWWVNSYKTCVVTVKFSKNIDFFNFYPSLLFLFAVNKIIFNTLKYGAQLGAVDPTGIKPALCSTCAVYQNDPWQETHPLFLAFMNPCLWLRVWVCFSRLSSSAWSLESCFFESDPKCLCGRNGYILMGQVQQFKCISILLDRIMNYVH